MKDPVTDRLIEIGILDEDIDLLYREVLADHTVKISKYFNENNCKARYEYDFGDSWIHTVKFEKILQAAVDEKYPKCIDGKMACPPEDCGGIYGYYDLLKVLRNPKNEDYNEMLEWLGGEFDPKKFDPKDVVFDNPQKRFKLM
ncbi:MAG: plasmid pRiA4b ORF-3 family protein [Ignavibacteria bacterium]|nr:MAG: plasmid pRiA4b ORF-3 family protein [Ignavibacteria bacterium]KAF0159945.1 MAG: plasmid pRiA4b ORF-3 family protein [Ignavibacteria bacterium]